MVEKSLFGNLWPSVYDPLRAFGQRVGDWLSPASDASSDDEAYRIKLELPGVSEDDIDLTVDGGVLTVKGEKRIEREEKGETWYVTERQVGRFVRSFRLPEDADADKVDAVLKDGVLSVTLPRRAPKAEGSKRVSISRG